MASRIVIALCCVILGTAVTSLPIRDFDYLQSAWETSGGFQGDILLADDDDRNGVLEERRHWPNGTLYYLIDDTFDPQQMATINAAIDDINTLTCVTLKEYEPGQPHYVHVRGDGDGCMSYIGRQRFSPQRLNLGPGCVWHGIIIHEFLHALGFHHMQSTAIRDDYVNIHWDNIIPIDVPNFFKFSNETTSDYGLPYDYGSVMHYGNYAFTSNGNMTITTIDEDAVIGQRDGLSESDIIKVDIMYGCRPE